MYLSISQILATSHPKEASLRSPAKVNDHLGLAQRDFSRHTLNRCIQLMGRTFLTKAQSTQAFQSRNSLHGMVMSVYLQ